MVGYIALFATVGLLFYLEPHVVVSDEAGSLDDLLTLDVDSHLAGVVGPAHCGYLSVF